MANGAAVVQRQVNDSKDHKWGSGPTVEYICTCTFDANYATGGQLFDLNALFGNDFPTGKIYFVSVANVPLGYIPRYDAVNKKILLYSTPGTELANASVAVAAGVCDVRVLVRGI